MSTTPHEQAPESRETVGGFFGSRIGWRELKEHVFLEPVKGGTRWAAAFGSLLLFTFSLQVVTGILLTMNYAPSVTTAWQSVNYIQHEVPMGWLIRGLHHWGSSAMVILLLIHLLQVYIWGAYKRPRELTWMTGVLMLGAVMGLAFTGYLLPWDEKAYWASKVGLGISSTTPIIGQQLRLLMQGGPDMGNLTLTRFFAVHAFVLPGAIIGLVMVHLYLFRRPGVTPGWWKSEARVVEEQEPFWPGQVWKDLVAASALLLVLVIWTYYNPAPLADIANPSKPYEARPEWYFMFLFELLKYFNGPYEVIGTFVLPSVGFAVIFLWPLLDRNPERDPRRRPVAISLLCLGTAGLLGMTFYAIKVDTRMHEPAAAIAKEPHANPAAGPLQKLDAAKLFTDNCEACHAKDGTGSQLRAVFPAIPDFTDAAWHKTQKDADLQTIINNGGKDLQMPAFKDKLTAEQVQALVIYIRAFEAATPPAK